jgi:hypothetical protein
VLLAALLLRPNQLVPADELVDQLWDGTSPNVDRAHKTLHMVVRRLRVVPGAADCVRTRPGGYQAVIEPDQVDLLRFRALVGSGDFGAGRCWSTRRPSGCTARRYRNWPTNGSRCWSDRRRTRPRAGR